MRIQVRHPSPLAAALLTAVTLAACSSSQGKGPAASTEDAATSSDAQLSASTGTDTGSDTPVWVNASMLTCDWQTIESDTTAGVHCAATPGAGAPADLKPFTWTVLDGNKKPVSATQRPDASGTVFVLPAISIGGYSVQVTMSDGSSQGQLAKPFKAVLSGLSDDKLQNCLQAQLPVAQCFAAIGIKIPSGDLIAAANVKKADSACANPSMLTNPGANCQITTDGMTGDYDFAEVYFVNGNDLVATDGTVKAGDFCDANGIKPSWSKGNISVQQRWYPYWTTGTNQQPCFHQLSANIVDASHKDVANQTVWYDPSQGVGGEPYCFFVLIDETTTLFGGQMVRMHILKNPKIFKDAANPWLTADTIKATTSQFICQ